MSDVIKGAALIGWWALSLTGIPEGADLWTWIAAFEPLIIGLICILLVFAVNLFGYDIKNDIRELSVVGPCAIIPVVVPLVWVHTPEFVISRIIKTILLVVFISVYAMRPYLQQERRKTNSHRS